MSEGNSEGNKTIQAKEMFNMKFFMGISKQPYIPNELMLYISNQLKDAKIQPYLTEDEKVNRDIILKYKDENGKNLGIKNPIYKEWKKIMTRIKDNTHKASKIYKGILVRFLNLMYSINEENPKSDFYKLPNKNKNDIDKFMMSLLNYRDIPIKEMAKKLMKIFYDFIQITFMEIPSSPGVAKLISVIGANSAYKLLGSKVYKKSNHLKMFEHLNFNPINFFLNMKNDRYNPLVTEYVGHNRDLNSIEDFAQGLELIHESYSVIHQDWVDLSNDIESFWDLCTKIYDDEAEIAKLMTTLEKKIEDENRVTISYTGELMEKSQFYFDVIQIGIANYADSLRGVDLFIKINMGPILKDSKYHLVSDTGRKIDIQEVIHYGFFAHGRNYSSINYLGILPGYEYKLVIEPEQFVKSDIITLMENAGF